MSLRNTIIAAVSLAFLSLAPVAPTQATPAVTKSDSALREKADKQIADALKVVQKMKAEAELWALVQQAKGIFIVPHYARAGLVVGGQGGQGVLLFNQDGKWGNPLFYNIGGVSLGAQAGVEVGPIVMLLMNDKAASRAMTENNFALNADAGLTLVNYSKRAQAGVQKGDIVVWSDTKGAFVDASISLTDIVFDENESAAWYGVQGPVTAEKIRTGKVGSPASTELQNAFAK